MDLKDSSENQNNRLKQFIGGMVVLAIVGCMEKPRVSVTEPPATSDSESTVNQPTPSVQEPDANARAAAAMVRRGRQHLTRGETDAAIRILERSVALDSTNGENYYYLAEAWLMKKNAGQASQFNRLAGIQLAPDTAWKTRIDLQKNRIDQLEK